MLLFSIVNSMHNVQNVNKLLSIRIDFAILFYFSFDFVSFFPQKKNFCPFLYSLSSWNQRVFHFDLVLAFYFYGCTQFHYMGWLKNLMWRITDLKVLFFGLIRKIPIGVFFCLSNHFKVYRQALFDVSFRKRKIETASHLVFMCVALNSDRNVVHWENVAFDLPT